MKVNLEERLRQNLLHLDEKQIHISLMMILLKKKAEGTKVCVIERILKFNHYKDFLFNNNPILQYLNLQDLKVKHTMYILKKSTRLQ